MSLLCSLGLHKWNACKCRTCDAYRDQQHRYKGCVCEVCGKQNHRWDGCICSACKKQRNSGHRWIGDRCALCGRSRSELERQFDEAVANLHNRDRKVFLAAVEALGRLGDERAVAPLKKALFELDIALRSETERMDVIRAIIRALECLGAVGPEIGLNIEGVRFEGAIALQIAAVKSAQMKHGRLPF